MNRSHTGPGRNYLRRDKRMQPHTKDSYREPKRPAGDRICEGCGAVCDAGRWTWYATPLDRRQLECPACKRMRENVPAGELVLQGAYLSAHRSTILELLRHQADLETSEHALERIMDIDTSADSLIVRTTGVHMVRRLGEALLHAHHGDLALDYRDGEDVLRAHWKRDDA
ncbi:MULTISPECIES: BCAM0308 family protein [unclassified Burkholderia]|uniref:BCAM0308 family protein n=1 Tax=unclassified Burkholderia TaxID=2613784 RepID=UPI000F56DFD4|nr:MULTISPECIES: BCAM0308 family protein [unclassified Burkholderia]RQR46114.1 glutamyl-tRNA amidotransferase [Burkholderia sp. Bp9131]RQR78758.1 glutamyl-tRNA amidotransferase [Burkholderia sp. Bp9015]RQS30004.1 glutamyl-tRNA amidotransferase [Burkholderia sp. Bp8995]RQS48167.1 glutamyl-tRNA amidotransferase [Burkholderia sp. Bp8989]RQZ41826.1 glutamyl-tRNA amidotransferase [Burkholderia sp. Bp9090]